MWRSRLLPPVALAIATMVSCDPSKATSVDSAPASRVGKPARPKVALRVPSDDEIPGGPDGDAVRAGRDLATHTFERLPKYVGGDLHCTSCHLGGGTTASAGPWVGVTSIYPEYRARAGRNITIEDRIDECFERSLNGKPLPRGGPEMAAFVAYMGWLSRGVPRGTEVIGRGFVRLERPPNFDSTAGKSAYAVRCASCHGIDGAGRRSAKGGYFVPPLWGPRSFNIGAGMARLDTAAAFVRHNMPLGQGNTLTIWEAYDIAAYFIEQPRDEFEGKRLDWPHGGKPTDARY